METVLQVEHLTKRYGALTAVDHLSLEVYAGEVFGLLGPNGAGKTTAISMMCGLLRPDSGQVLIQGRSVNDGSADVRARVGMCPQETVLWEKLTCLEQMEFVDEMYGVSGRVSRQRGGDLLETLGLTAKANRLAGTLSGGMKRRLNLALALIHDPDVLVLDEPEAGLDPQSRVMVRDFIRSLARRRTVILTTHNMDEAERLADRVAIIDHGRLLVVDTPDVLKRTAGEGDVLEITLDGIPLDVALAALDTIAPSAAGSEHALTIRARGAVDVIPAVLDALRGAGAQVGEVRLRASTLEDVFLSLTGRSLRE